jgi:hypothetical protein
MAVLGLVLLLVGWLLGLHILFVIGIVLLVIGLILLALSFSATGPMNGRRYY